MVSSHTARGLWGALLMAAIVAVSLNVSCASPKKPVAPSDFVKVNETELQSRVMSFVDRMSAILLTAFARYDKTKPGTQDRNQVLSIVVYALWNAYTIASESDPDIALLDMISMVTLGRIVFEEQGVKTFGPSVQPIVKGFRKAEQDIRGIAVLALDQQQLDRLMALIRRWRQANPELTYFPFVRFSNFAAERRDSKLARSEAPQGLIDSVEAATQQAEEMRLLAERGLYLGTRMPQLASLFAELWAAKLAADITTERRDAIGQLKNAVEAERRASIEDFMNNLSTERQNAITQFMDAFEIERQATIEDFMTSVTTERRNTIAQMETVLTSERQATIEDFMARNRLIVADALQQMNQNAETLVDKALHRITILMALFLAGLALANLMVGYIILRKGRERKRPPASR